MSLRRACSFATRIAVMSWMLPAAANAACVSITTPAELDQMRLNKAGGYCLTNDLDMAGFGPFAPVGTLSRPFTGTLDGQGHVIRNLTVNSTQDEIGLFGVIDGGTVSNLTLAGVSVTSPRGSLHAGGLAGSMWGTASVSNVRVTGNISCARRLCRLGGIVGQGYQDATISDSSSDAFVAGQSGGAAGGIGGQIGGQVFRSFATGRISCQNHCAAGGLVGHMTETAKATDSFATGPVYARRASLAGGFAGFGGTAERCYATGSATIKADAAAAFVGNFVGPTSEVFAAGRVRTAAPGIAGGFAAQLDLNQPADNSYWDKRTTRKIFSVRGAGKRTAELQADLPTGFGSGWGITKGFSYPYLNLLDSGMFASTLATLVTHQVIFTFVPLSQREPTEYQTAPAHAKVASLAAVYAMVARAIGLTRNIAALEAVKIDQDFWNDATQTASWAGPLTNEASLGNFVAIGGGASLDDSNVIGAIKGGSVVAIRGTYTRQGGGSVKHWMLATLFTSDGVGNVTALVANDPYTGTQVRIDPTTKQVIFPAGFPLSGFTVDGYRTITPAFP